MQHLKKTVKDLLFAQVLPGHRSVSRPCYPVMQLAIVMQLCRQEDDRTVCSKYKSDTARGIGRKTMHTDLGIVRAAYEMSPEFKAVWQIAWIHVAQDALCRRLPKQDQDANPISDL